MGKLTLKLLGPPEILHDGRPARFRAKKALALLAYLAVEGGARPRGEITALLWPRSDDARGRAALRSALSGLRKTLEEAAEEPHHYLFADGGSLGLTFGPELELDLHALEAAHALARSNPRPEELEDDACRDVLAGLRAGAAVYRGDFLEGFSLDGAPEFDLWVEAEREAWRGRMDLVYDHLSKFQLECGETEAAIAAAARWTEHAPSSEEAHRRLMEAQFAAGDRSGALNTYEALRWVLDRALGTQPGPETEALIAHARGGGAPEERVAMRPVASAASWPETPRAFPGTTPFVGRAREFGALVGAYQDALSEEARAVVLLGDAGIGKTRLTEEFLLWVRGEGADVISGSTHEAGGRLPYGVLIDAMRPRIERERAPDDLLEDVWLSELSRILPELRERYPDLPPPSADEARTNLFEAITRLVAALAERSPVVLFLDDLHWASRATLDVLRYAGRRWAEEGARVLLVLGLRAEATEALPSPTGWASELGHALPIRRFVLGPLAAGDTLDLVRMLAGKTSRRGDGEQISPDLERFGQWLFEETGGHPLFLAETIKVLLERGALVARPRAGNGASWAVALTPEAREPGALGGILPESVREAIGAQLSRLSPAASNLLSAGAVLGTGFTFEQLVRVAGMEEGEGLFALDEALASRLVREADPSNDGYAFSHDKVRDVAYTEAGAARRGVFHRRALETLEEEDAPAAWLARHALTAKMPEAAFGHLLAAGDAAMAVFAAEDATGYYEQARGLLGEEPGGRRGSRAPPPAREIEHLHVNLGRARELAGEWEEAQSTYEEMLSRAREARDHRLEWAALNRLAILAAQRHFDMERANALIQESLKAAEAYGDRAMLAETEWNLAQMATIKWELEAALSHGARALELARELGLKELEARTLYVLSLAHTFAGQWEECVARASRAAALYEVLGDKPTNVGQLAAQFIWAGAPPSKELANRATEALALSLLTTGEINRGSPRVAVEVGRRAVRITWEIDNEWARMGTTVPLGNGLWETGEYKEALRLARQGLETARNLQHPAAILLLIVLGNTPQEMLGLEEARAALLEALEVADAMLLARPWRTTAVSKLCTNRALAGDWEAAHRYALEAAAIRGATPRRLWFFDFERHHETEALLKGGDGELAREDARRLGERIGQNRRFRLVHLRMLAVLDRWDGDPEGAIGHLQEAEALAEEMGLPGELWQVRADLGELHEERGEPEEAREVFALADATVRELADKMEEAELQSSFLGTPQVRRMLDRQTRVATPDKEPARGLPAKGSNGRNLRAKLPTGEIEHLYVNSGRAYELAGQWDKAQNTYEEMLSRAREARDHRLECAALNRLAILATQRHFDVGRAAALLRESLKAAKASSNQATMAETEWNLAQMAAMRWEPEVALSHGERALGLARELGLEELEARSLFVLGQAYRFAGRWKECVACASRSAALYGARDEPPDTGTLAAQFIWAGAPPSKELANRAMEALALSLLAIGELNRGSPRDVVEAVNRALRIGREIDNDWAQTNAMVLICYGLWDTGEYGEALRVAKRGLEMSRKVRHPAATFMLAVLGSTPQAMLNLEEARAALLEALEVADGKLPQPWKTTAISKLCANRALAGDWEAARHYALEVMATRNAAPTRLIGFDFYRHHETEALLRSGDEALACEDVRRLGERVGQNRRFRLVHLRMLAVLDRWDGDPEGAIGHLREAEALAEEMGLPGELWQVRADLGELHEESGDDEQAEQAFSRAAEILRTLAGRIDDPKLREGFLSASQVRRVLER